MRAKVKKVSTKIVARVTMVSTEISAIPRLDAAREVEPPTNAVDAMTKALLAEESVRVRIRILDGYVEHGWTLGDAKAEASKRMPPGYSLGKKGEVRRKR